jgi:glycosyltransferase involved in cell wall biosynthesis
MQIKVEVMQTFLVSIVMTVFNGEVFLKDAIDSCLNQTYSNIELIIIDDGSIDNSLSIIKKYTDPRIRLIQNQTNKGQSFSRNKCIKESQGEYIAIMDADDIAYPNRIEKQLNFLINRNVNICFSNAILIDSQGNPTGERKTTQTFNLLKAQLLFYCPLIHPTAFWRKESFINCEFWYDEYFTYAQDYDLWTRAIKKLKFGFIDEFLLKFRFRNEQSISFLKVAKQEEYRRLISNREIYALTGKMTSFNGSIISIVRIFRFFQKQNQMDSETINFFRDLTNVKFKSMPYRLKKAIQKFIIN